MQKSVNERTGNIVLQENKGAIVMGRKIWFIIVCLCCNIDSFATDNKHRNFADIAFDYICESANGLNKNNCEVKEVTYKQLPNKNIVIDMWIILHQKYKEELHATDGHYFTQANGIGPVTYSKTAYKIRHKDWNYRYIVFLRSDGTPLKIEARPNYSNIETWNNCYWFFLDKHNYNLDGMNYEVYESIECRTMDGEPLWKLTDMIVFSMLKTDNNLYLAGEKVNDVIHSLVRCYDIKTGKVVNEKNGENGGICLGLRNGDNGIDYIEYSTSTKKSKSFSIPYELNDRSMHLRQIMSRYNQNKASDQVEIGERYLKGNGFDKDEKLAFNWFKKAADQNNDKGLERLAYCYKNGLGVNQDKAKAVFYYEEAAKVGNTDAMADVVKMYVDGDGIPNNMSRALYWQETLAFKGDKESQKYVISHQTIEHEMPGISSDAVHKLGMDAYKASDYEWAKFCFERGLSLGNKQSQLYLGIMYMQGQGVYHNYAKAIDYMKDLAEAGDVAAQCNIATMYKHGDVENGINRDEKKYVFWLNLASENGDKDAQYEMAQRYENGLLVKKDKKKAVELYEKVAKNYQEVKIKLIYMYAAGKGVKKDQERALYFFESLPADVEGEVADNIFWGNSGAKKDKKFGLELYKKAAARGNKEALKSYQLWSK